MFPAPGDRFDPRGILGEGAMGIVHRVYDRKVGHEVALKTLREFDPDSALYLRREFRALRTIRHPNLVRLYELVATGEQCLFTMELLEGEDLLTWCRGDTPPGELPRRAFAEVADVFLQVAEGLAAVHAAERLHRDIKPTNVLVTAAGEARVLDFGLAHAFSPGRLVVAPDGMSGSIDYASPEQAWSDGVGPQTDWYSYGVILFEVLSGTLPYPEANPGRRLLAMKKRDAPSVAERVAGVPDEVVGLVAALLSRDPSRRAGYAEVAAVLGPVSARPRPSVAAPTGRLPFVGRRAQMTALRRTFDRVHAGEAPAALVMVSGPSGMGKSELLRRFTAQAESERDALVLQGRCQPQEAVPFKAFDAIVDELSIHLSRLDPADLAAMVPADAAALLRIFPVLARVPALEGGASLQPVEPRELRRWGYRAFRELLGNLAAREPVVLHIDDAQWGDLDSVTLLVELLRGPTPPRLVVLVSFRSEHTSPALQALADAAQGELAALTETLEVGPFAADDLRELAVRLRGAALVDDGVSVDELLDQAEGSPFFVGELVRWHRSRPPGSVGRASLHELIRGRVAQLTPVQREVLETVAIAGHPLDPSLALRAAGVVDGGADVLHALDETFLRRVAVGAEDDVVEPLHDRIREVVAADVPGATRSARHLALATELRRLPEADPLLLLEHYRAGGDTGEAAYFAELAARHAEATLAFGLAAELYRAVLALRGDAAGVGVHERLAEALKNAGLGVDAAHAYLHAAEVAERTPDHAADARRLRQRAAEQLLHNGLIPRGMALLEEGLRKVGVAMPGGPWRGLLRAAWGRLRLALRGLRFTPRDPATLPAAVSARLDTLWGATTALSMFSHSRADPLGVLHLRLALDAGDERRVARALRYEAAFQAGLGGGLVGRLLQYTGVLATVETLPDDGGDAYDRGWTQLCRACVAWFRADWRACWEAGREGERIFRTECRGAHWEIAVINLFALAALVFLGEVEEVDRRVREGLRDAEQRGDQFAASIYQLGEPLTVWLYADLPDEAERLAQGAIAAWPATEFDTQHYHHLLATAHIALYRGDPWAAWSGLLGRWRPLVGSALLEYLAVRAELLHLRARVALACAQSRVEPPPALARWSRPRLLAEAARCARRIRAIRELAWSAALADSIDGTLDAMEGRPEEARARLAAAATGFEARHMRVFAACAWHRAALAGGGGRSAAEIEATLRGWGIVAPARFLRMLAPWEEAVGLDSLLFDRRGAADRPLHPPGFAAEVEPPAVTL